MSDLELFLLICALGLVTLLTRTFFLIPEQDLPMPAWLQQGLRYAPLAALVAVVAPEVLMSQGELIGTWRDARPYAALVGAAAFFWRRSILHTIIAGSATLLLLKLVLGW